MRKEESGGWLLLELTMYLLLFKKWSLLFKILTKSHCFWLLQKFSFQKRFKSQTVREILSLALILLIPRLVKVFGEKRPAHHNQWGMRSSKDEEGGESRGSLFSTTSYERR
jgi:hypothetical protein